MWVWWVGGCTYVCVVCVCMYVCGVCVCVCLCGVCVFVCVPFMKPVRSCHSYQTSRIPACFECLLYVVVVVVCVCVVERSYVKFVQCMSLVTAFVLSTGNPFRSLSLVGVGRCFSLQAQFVPLAALLLLVHR